MTSSSSSNERKMAGRKNDSVAPVEPRETNSIVFEWPLRGLKQMFENSKSDQKSKVIKSTPFGGGRWTVLFYAQSGHEQFCSLYLNAEPLPHERIHPLLAGGSQAVDLARDTAAVSSKSKNEGNLEERWTRRGLFRFTFNIQTMDDKTNLGTKEAHDHAFSHKTSNWGWAQFAKRDHVYYKNADVIRDDGFLISVTIISSPEKPKMAKPISHTVPPILVQAMGSLLDDPEHSDVVFHLHSRRRAEGGNHKTKLKKVYAIRKILAARSEYFRDMFESGFQEAEAEESSSDEEPSQNDADPLVAGQHGATHPQRIRHAAARIGFAKEQADSEDDDGLVDDEELDLDDEEVEGRAAIMEDSDEEIEDIFETGQIGSSHVDRASLHKDHSPNEDEEVDSEEEDDEDEEDEDENEAGNERSLKAQTEEEIVEAEYEGEGQATGDVTHTSTPTTSRTMVRKSSRHDSSKAFVDATSSQNTESVSSRGYRRDTPHTRVKTSHSSDEMAMDGGDLSADVMPTIRASASPTPPRSRKREPVPPTNEATTVSTKDAATSTRLPHPSRKRRKVSIVDSAYPTFKSLLFFLYTDTVEFAPLTSSFLPPDVAADDAPNSSSSTTALFASRRGREPSGRFFEEMAKARKKRKAVIEAHLASFPDRPSPCSAKAMYRLADKLDIPDLKQRAQEHIAMSLTIQNIVWEVFSGFTAHYPDILKLETDFLLKHWPQVKRVNAMKSIFLRHSAHPGLAQVWPHLLECLEYRRPDVDETDDAAS